MSEPNWEEYRLKSSAEIVKAYADVAGQREESRERRWQQGKVKGVRKRRLPGWVYRVKYRLTHSPWSPVCWHWSIPSVFRRLRNGYWGSELWALDTALADWFLPRLRAFRATDRHGLPHPSIFLEGDEKEEALNCGDDWYHRWDAEGLLNVEIDKMIRAFELIQDDDMDITHVCLFLETAAMREFHDIMEREKREGLESFAKYLEFLWD